MAHSNAQRFGSSNYSEFDYIPNSALRVSDFTPKCIGVFVVYLNITERSSQLRVAFYWRVNSEQSGESLLFALLWLGNFKTSGCLVGRPTCAPARTRLTPQLVGTSAITYNLSPYICINIVFGCKQAQQYIRTHQLGFIRAVSWSAQNAESHWSQGYITLTVEHFSFHAFYKWATGLQRDLMSCSSRSTLQRE